MYVPQGNSLLSGTIRENLRLVAPEATDDQLREVLELSAAEYLNHRFSHTKKTIFAGKENYLRMDTAVAVGSHWMVACRLFYPAPGSSAEADTFALYGSATPRNRAWFFDQEWLPFTRSTVYPRAMSLWIEPVVSTSRDGAPPVPLPVTEIRTAYSPETRLLYFQLPSDWHRTVNIEILDVNGKSVYHQTSYTSQSPFFVPAYLRSGLYVLRIRDAYHSHSQKVFF